jgi:hypothetical protein
MNTSYGKSKEITIGGIPIPVYMMPDGEYRWSMRQASKAIGYGDTWLRDTIRADGNALVKLKSYGFENDVIEVLGQGFIETHLISTSDFLASVAYAALVGERKQAVALLVASMQETLERRADYAFGVVRDEDEYIQKFEYRYASMILNKNLRSAVSEWINSQSQVELQQYIKIHRLKGGQRGIYARTLGEIYQAVFGKWKKDINKCLDVPLYRTPKDSVHVTQLQRITQIEDLAAKYIIRKGEKPIEAIRLAAEALMIEAESPKLGDRITRADVNLVLKNK